MNDGPDLFDGDTIGDGAITMDFPFMHFAQGTDHGPVSYTHLTLPTTPYV